MKPSLSCKPNQCVERRGAPFLVVIVVFLDLGPGERSTAFYNSWQRAPILATYLISEGSLPIKPSGMLLLVALTLEVVELTRAICVSSSNASAAFACSFGCFGATD